MLHFFRKRWFLLALGIVLAAGFLFPGNLTSVVAWLPKSAIVAAVLFIMALPLETGAMWQALRRPGPVALAVAVNFGLIPPLAWLVSQAMPVNMTEIATGLVITATIPSTLVSAVVWTRRAGGNDAVAILGTIVTNAACFLVTPAWLKLLTHTTTSLPFGPLVGRLALLVVTPMLIAQLLRLSKPIADWSTRQKTPLGVLAQIGILAMVSIGAVGAGSQVANPENGNLTLTVSLIMIAATVGVHVVALWLAHVAARAVRLARADRIAVGFSGSQKTMTVGLYICLEYFSDKPLAILPLVTYHVCQLLVDTLVADRLRESGQRLPAVTAEDEPDAVD